MRFVSSVIGCICTAFLSASFLAASTPLCQCGPPTAESYKWNFSNEAADLLSQVNVDSYYAERAAARLESYDRAERELIDWHADAAVLSRERYWANDMDRKLCRLETIKRVLPAAQRAEINEVAPAILEVTNTTQATMQYLRANPNQLFIAAYENYADALYSEARRAKAASANAMEYREANYRYNAQTAYRNLKTSS